MKVLKRIILFITILSFLTIILLNVSKKSTYASSELTYRNNEKLINVGVSLFKIDDPYMSMVKQDLEKIEDENKDKVKFTFFDGKNNQTMQSETLNTLFNNDYNYDLLLINLVDAKESLMEDIINKAKQINKPVILFNVAPPFVTSSMKNYSKVVIIGTDNKQAGSLQGKILVDMWNTDKMSIDRNGNNILEYVMLQGKIDTTSAIDRTKYSISTIKNAGIQTKELALRISDWNQELAKNNVEALLARYGNNIEAIIANNDAMAIGAVEALQKYGYNKGDTTKNIAVVGIDGIPEAIDLVNKGILSGTVIQSSKELATTLYTVGTNLVYDRPPLDDTNFKFDQTGVIINMPFYEYNKPK